MPPPSSVPAFIVTLWRTSQSAPTTSRVRPPRKLTDCGGAPTEAKGLITVRGTIVVWPMRDQFIIIADHTFPSMTQYGPMVVPFPIIAPDSISAVGWIATTFEFDESSANIEIGGTTGSSSAESPRTFITHSPSQKLTRTVRRRIPAPKTTSVFASRRKGHTNFFTAHEEACCRRQCALQRVS